MRGSRGYLRAPRAMAGHCGRQPGGAPRGRSPPAHAPNTPAQHRPGAAPRRCRHARSTRTERPPRRLAQPRLLAEYADAGFAWVQVHAPPRPMLADRRHGLRHAHAVRAALDGSGLRLLVHAPDDLSAGTFEHDRAFDGLLDHAAAAGAELIAYHGLNFADTDGPTAARARERTQLEERSLIPRLQRTPLASPSRSRPCPRSPPPPPPRAGAATPRPRSAPSPAGSTRPPRGCCSPSATCTSPPMR